MLGWLLLGALLVGTTIVISGIITKRKLKDKMREKGVENALIQEINTCTNTMSLYDLDTETEYEVQGDGIADELQEGDCIYA